MIMDRPKPYTFVIRGLQWTRVIERTFYADSEQDRQEWLHAIDKVKESLTNSASTCIPNSQQFNQKPGSSQSSDDTDVIMLDPAEEMNDPELYNKFVVNQGTSYGKQSGRKKVVS